MFNFVTRQSAVICVGSEFLELTKTPMWRPKIAIAEITLNRPERLNTLDSQMAGELTKRSWSWIPTQGSRYDIERRWQILLRWDRCKRIARKISNGIPRLD
jgi:hypothetical protein